MNVAISINHPGVSSVDPFTVETLHVTFIESFLVVEKSGEGRWSKRYAKHNISHLALFQFLPAVIDDPHVKSGHRLTSRAGLNGKWRLGIINEGFLCSCSSREGNPRDGGTRFRRPPVVDDLRTWCAMFLEKILIHANYTRLAPFTCKK